MCIGNDGGRRSIIIILEIEEGPRVIMKDLNTILNHVIQ